MSRNFIKVLGLFFVIVFGLIGCGGGGGGGTPTPVTPGGNVTPITVSGTASEGALITGKTVKLKDANGTSAADGTTNATTGIYTIDVTGLTAPFLVTVTGTNGTYVSLAQTAGTANINPITTTVVALAAGNSDVSALFTSITPAQLTTINTNYTAKSALVTASLQSALPAGVQAQDYFTGAITVGTGMDAVFDTYRITVNPTTGITVKTRDASATTVLSIPVAIITANTDQALPILTIPAVNIAPVANAGTAQSVVTGAVITLDGSASSDANGDLLTYNWSFTSKPAASSATLSSATLAKPTFTADVAGTYVLNLVVNDGKVSSAAVTVTITVSVSNVAPVAKAGSAQSVVTGAVVTLDGSASSDANGDLLTYRWAFTSKPAGSNAALSSTTTVKPTFTADVVGTYVFNLTVNDGKVSSSSSVVSVVSIANNGSISVGW